MSEELVYRERLKATRGQRLRGALSPLQRAHEALVDKVYAGELEGGVLCSEGSARQLPLFRGCALGTPAEAARLFAWVEGFAEGGSLLNPWRALDFGPSWRGARSALRGAWRGTGSGAEGLRR